MATIVLIGTACAPPSPPPVLTGVPGPVTARITVSQSRNLDPAVQTAAFAAAADVGAGAALLHGGTLGVTGLGRNGGWYVLPPPGAQYPGSRHGGRPRRRPPSCTASPSAECWATARSILSDTSAGLFGAAAGDVVQVRRWDNGGVAEFIVGAVIGRRQAAGRAGDVDRVGREHRLRAPDQRPDLRLQVRPGGDEGARRARPGPLGRRIGHPGRRGTRRPTRRSTWPRPRPSSGSSGTCHRRWDVSIDPAWQQANLVRTAFAGDPDRGHLPPHVAPAIQGALNEIAAAGLAGAIDVTNTNRYGGCFGPREVRSDGGTTGGNLSRHTWGMALDMNTASNPMGGVPHDGLPRRVDLPQVGVRVGWQLHDPRRHALRVGR